MNNNTSINISDLIFQLLSLGSRVEQIKNSFSIYCPVSKKEQLNNAPSTMIMGGGQQGLMDVIRSAMSQVEASSGEWVLAANVDASSFQKYARALIKEYKIRPSQIFNVGYMVRHKNGFGPSAYSNKGMIIDVEYDTMNHSNYYLIEYYISYIHPMGEKPCIIKTQDWVPENALEKEPFTEDVEAAGKLLEGL